MYISLANYIRKLAGMPQTNVSKAFQQFITEIGKKDPHLTKTSPDELMTQFKAVVEPLVDHGLSGDKYDEIMKILDSKTTAKEMIRYISNFMLSGAGMAVQASSLKQMVDALVSIHKPKDILSAIEEACGKRGITVKWELK